ncbi:MULTISPECIES: hypothetical protein [Rhodomicrobium]|uniref:hypothetical protein n=1 Tax=Rhodomicrobium TaxID=1068 RepID=UPI000F742C1D|nr:MULTISPECIES: hypothetical protein [Rhodomicrobium]
MSLSKLLQSRLAAGVLATTALVSPLPGQAQAAGGSLLKIDQTKPANFISEQYHTPSYLMLAAAPAAKLDELFGKPEGARTADAPLRGGEFYTFLAMRNRFLDPVAIKNCNGSRDSWFTAAKLGIEYKGKRGTARGSALPETVLFAYGNNSNPDAKTKFKGCIFASAGDRVGPYLIHSDFAEGEGEYELHFVVTAGRQLEGDAFATIAKLALSASAVWMPIAAPVGALVSTVATDLDKLLSQNSASSIQYLAILTADRDGKDGDSYPAGYYFKISSPNWLTEGVGSMEIYQSRSASIILDANPGENALISPEEILSHQGLGAGHRCLPGNASCAKEDFFSKALGQSFELYGEIAASKAPKTGAPAETTAPAVPATDAVGERPTRETGGEGSSSTKTSWAKVFALCEKIKATAQDLGLSKIDALLVRWALLNRAKLYPVLKAYHEDKKAAPFAGAILAAARVGDPAPETACWDFGSDGRQLALIQDIMKKKFAAK